MVEEEGQRQRDDEERVVRNVGLDQVAQRLVTKLEDGLDPAGLTARSFDRSQNATARVAAIAMALEISVS